MKPRQPKIEPQFSFSPEGLCMRTMHQRMHEILLHGLTNVASADLFNVSSFQSLLIWQDSTLSSMLETAPNLVFLYVSTCCAINPRAQRCIFSSSCMLSRYTSYPLVEILSKRVNYAAIFINSYSPRPLL